MPNAVLTALAIHSKFWTSNSLLFHVLHIFLVMLFCYSSPTFYLKLDKKMCGEFKMQLIHQFSESIMNAIKYHLSLTNTQTPVLARAACSPLLPPSLSLTHAFRHSSEQWHNSLHLSLLVYTTRVCTCAATVGMGYITHSCYINRSCVRLLDMRDTVDACVT